MDINALLKALPLGSIESQWLALVGLLVEKWAEDPLKPKIELLEPPAGGLRVPYVDPVHAVALMARQTGYIEAEAEALGKALFAELRPTLPLLERPVLYTGVNPDIRNIPECVPVPKLVAFLREKGSLPLELPDFLEKACEVTCLTRQYRWDQFGKRRLRLAELPDLPPPKTMIESFVWLQIIIGETLSPESEAFPAEPIHRWREAIRPIAERLASALGEPVYYFADPKCECDDDDCHRFLALHCWCSLLPDSNFVRYLLEVTGAPEVESLKNALVDPASYTYPFKNDAFVDIEPVPMPRFQFPRPWRRRRVGIVFGSEPARERAREIALTQIGEIIIFVAPKEVMPDTWVEEAARLAQGWGAWYGISRPIALLADIDELHVIENRPRPIQGGDLCVAPEVEELMWRAYEEGVPLHFHGIDGRGLGNPETCLEGRGVPARVAAQEAARWVYLHALKVIRVDSEYGSSGLWSVDGKNLPYDFIYLPYPLVRRLAAWQRDHDDTLIPILPETADNAWWDAHIREEQEIAAEVQEFVGSGIEVQIFDEGNWIPICDRNAGENDTLPASDPRERALAWELRPRVPTDWTIVSDLPEREWQSAWLKVRNEKRPQTEKWRRFVALMQPGDRIGYFDSGKPPHLKPHGRAGYTLSRGDEIVAQVFVMEG